MCDICTTTMIAATAILPWRKVMWTKIKLWVLDSLCSLDDRYCMWRYGNYSGRTPMLSSLLAHLWCRGWGD